MTMNLLKNFYCICFIWGVFLSCSTSNENDYINEIKTPKLLSLKFTKELNPYLLYETADCQIVDDSVLICRIPNIMPNKILKASFEYEGDFISINDTKVQSGVTEFDYKTPVKVGIHSGNSIKYYTLYVYSFTGLPIVWIDTEGRKEISSKDNYIRAFFKLEENVVTRSAGDITEDSISIKGRGNSTWLAPKKPYTLKFDNKISLFGEEKDKSWILLANYYDMTMLRNHTAFYMSSLSNLEYTPKAHFVEVMLNGKYIGTYQLCEKLKIGKHRVNVGDDGFLMEIDCRAPGEDAPYFSVPHLPNVVNVKDPDVTIGDEAYNYAKTFLTEADNVLFSDVFKDKEKGWQKYMDMKSFVDFFIINEVAKNGDVCTFYTSCYMNLKRGDKLKMGPIWDNDNSFGKHEDSNMWPIEGWYMKKTLWYSRLLQDPIFVNELKNRYAYFYSLKYNILMEINSYAEYLKYAVYENNARWNTLYNNDIRYNYILWGSYQNEIQYLKDWLSRRMDWLNTEINKL